MYSSLCFFMSAYGLFFGTLGNHDTKFAGSKVDSFESSEHPRKRAKMIRSYWTAPTVDEVEGIRYIVLTLGKEPLLRLKKLESELNKAADKFEKVHPFNVWIVVFSNTDTISALHNIKNRKLIWKKFMKGMGESFQEARDLNDMPDEYISDFAKKMFLPEPEIKKLLATGNWNGFVDYLLAFNKAPAETPDKYNQ